VVGFATGGLVVAIFFNWIRERDNARQLHEPVAAQWDEVTREARKAFGLLGTAEVHALGKPEAESYSRLALALWSDEPIDQAQWKAHTAGMRVAGLALIASATEFAEAHGIGGPKFQSARSVLEEKVSTLPEGGEPQPFEAAASELYTFCETVDRLHYGLMRDRLRRPAASRLATPALPKAKPAKAINPGRIRRAR
jgi:hypothetical protein